MEDDASGSNVRVKFLDGTTSYDGTAATFPWMGDVVPVSPLAFGTTYTASVLWQAPNNGKDALQQFTFTTASVPTVSTVPEDSFDGNQVHADSNSPAPIVVSITRLPSPTPTEVLTLKPGSTVRLQLPGAVYRACFTETPMHGYTNPGVFCQQSSWYSNPALKLGELSGHAGHWRVLLTAAPVAAGTNATVLVEQLCSQPSCSSTYRTVYRRSFTLATRQTLTVPGSAREDIEVDVPQSRHGSFLVASSAVSRQLP